MKYKGVYISSYNIWRLHSPMWIRSLIVPLISDYNLEGDTDDIADSINDLNSSLSGNISDLNSSLSESIDQIDNTIDGLEDDINNVQDSANSANNYALLGMIITIIVAILVAVNIVVSMKKR